METGSIEIIMEDGRAPRIEARLVNNTLWLSKIEIAKIFNCFPQKIEANLRSIFKSGLLMEPDVTHTRRYTYKGIERQCVYYNMEVLIFLSYRIASFEAGIFRKFVNEAFREHVKKKNKTRDYKIIWIAKPCCN
jgi:hypothetical protein